MLFNANSAISCREHINFQRDDDEVRFVQAELDFKCSLTETTVRSTPTHYPDSEPTRLLFLLNAACLAEKQQIPILVFGLTGTHDLPHANHYATNAFSLGGSLQKQIGE